MATPSFTVANSSYLMERLSQFPISRGETGPAWVHPWPNKLAKSTPQKRQHSDKSLKTDRSKHPKGRADIRDRLLPIPVLLDLLLSRLLAALLLDTYLHCTVILTLLSLVVRPRNTRGQISAQIRGIESHSKCLDFSESTDPNDAFEGFSCPAL